MGTLSKHTVKKNLQNHCPLNTSKKIKSCFDHITLPHLLNWIHVLIFLYDRHIGMIIFPSDDSERKLFIHKNKLRKHIVGIICPSHKAESKLYKHTYIIYNNIIANLPE